MLVPLIWILVSVALGLLFARFGPGAGGLILALVWGGCGLLYCGLLDLSGQRTSRGRSTVAIALLTGLAVFIIFSQSLADVLDSPGTALLKLSGIFAVFLLPSYLVLSARAWVRQRLLIHDDQS